MNRPVSLRAYCAAAGYTLVEILVATTLTLMLMGAVVAMFGRVGEGIGDSRSMLEAAERLRLAATRLQMDLTGVTVNLSNPRCRPEDNMGYFEYIDGGGSASTTNATGVSNDVLMFTTRSTGRPFVGRVPTTVNTNGTIQSDVAEVAWFIRDGKLYRRVLLVTPWILNQLDTNNDGVLQASELGLTDISINAFYAKCDISVRSQGTGLVPNTLGDLTEREWRFARGSTLYAASPVPRLSDVDATRTDDVILTNVIGFDVKYYGTNAYIDLAAGYSTWPEYATTDPPHPNPLRGIQVKIRTLEPDSKQVREVTVVQDFLPQ